jgi:hypothetical protein
MFCTNCCLDGELFAHFSSPFIAAGALRMARLPGEFLQAQIEANFRREIDRGFWRWSYTERHKCAIIDVPRLLLFRNLSIYLRGS